MRLTEAVAAGGAAFRRRGRVPGTCRAIEAGWLARVESDLTRDTRSAVHAVGRAAWTGHCDTTSNAVNNTTSNTTSNTCRVDRIRHASEHATATRSTSRLIICIVMLSYRMHFDSY